MKNNIAAIRKKKGLSQKEFAEILGISFWWLNHIENGKRGPSLKMAQNIADSLGVTLNDIFLDLNWSNEPIGKGESENATN